MFLAKLQLADLAILARTSQQWPRLATLALIGPLQWEIRNWMSTGYSLASPVAVHLQHHQVLMELLSYEATNLTDLITHPEAFKDFSPRTFAMLQDSTMALLPVVQLALPMSRPLTASLDPESDAKSAMTMKKKTIREKRRSSR